MYLSQWHTTQMLAQALVRTSCDSTSNSQPTQAEHCVTPIAQQLAYLACPSNGLTHIFEDTAVSQLQVLLSAGALQALDEFCGSPKPMQSLHHSVADTGLGSQHAGSQKAPSPARESLDALLQQQIQAVRSAEQQRTVEEILYLWCLHKLGEGGLSITTSLQADRPLQVGTSPTTFLPSLHEQQNIQVQTTSLFVIVRSQSSIHACIVA